MLVVYALSLSLSTGLPAARACTPQEIAELTAPSAIAYELRCQAQLGQGQTIVRPLRLIGAEASGATLDCAGQGVGRAGHEVSASQPTLAIWSRRETATRWSRPTDVTIKNCTIHGAIRIWGMGADGSYEDLKTSSQTAQHTQTTQAAAPTRITLDQLAFIAKGTIPLYVGPGVTNVILTGSRFSGETVATAIYLDAESAGNRIENNRFAVKTGREIIAVDGSARNQISHNRIELYGRGGIFLYRNCGERGVIRHQTPSNNAITDNVFSGASWLRSRLIVLGSREGRRSYCGEDAGYPFGSSADDGDHATNNRLARNRKG